MATKKAKPSVNSAAYTANLQLYEKVLATIPTIERKGDTMPYTSLNGNMFSIFTKEANVGLRLSSADRDAFLKKYKDAILVQYGIVMKEYVKVPDEVLKKTAELKKYLAKSYEYAQSLKPKATTKKKK